MDNRRLIKYMNQLLANACVMSTKLLRYYWYPQGARAVNLRQNFYESHLQFKQLMLDIGERILAINGKPLATLAKYLAETTVEEASAEQYLQEMMQQLAEDYDHIIHDIKNEGIYLANHLNDEQTRQLLVTWLHDLEQQKQAIYAYQIDD